MGQQLNEPLEERKKWKKEDGRLRWQPIILRGGAGGLIVAIFPCIFLSLFSELSMVK